MAFLQICRRHQALLEGASYSMERIFTWRSFYSCQILHTYTQRKRLCLEKQNFENTFLEPRLSSRPSKLLFTTQTFPLEQKLATSVSKRQSASGHKKKSKTAENNKKKKEKKSAEDLEAVSETSLKKIQDKVVGGGAKKKNSSSSKYASNTAGRKSSKKSDAKKSSAETKDVNLTTNHCLQENLDACPDTIKVAETLPVVGTAVIDEEHTLEYNPETILIEEEEDFHGETEIEDVGVSEVTHLATGTDLDADHELDMEFLSDVDHDGFKSRTETLGGVDDLDSMSDPHFDDYVPKKYREGTAGARLFKEQTLAEIDGYFYLGKPNEAEKLFNRYLRMGKKFEVDTFNKLLHGWAQKGNLMSIKLLFNLLKKEGLEPDMGTYAALLHGYGKFDDVDGVQNVIKEMEEKQFDINHIFHKCCLTEPQAKGVFKALRLADPNYQPSVPESQNQIRYPSLVESWYSSRISWDVKLNSVAGKLKRELEELKLKELFDEQISQELSGFTPILSVEDNKEDSKENDKRKQMFLDCRSKWRKALIENIEKELFEIKNSKGSY